MSLNRVQLVTLFWNGAPFYRYATGIDASQANSEAGWMIDRLTDSYSGTFNYHVDEIDWRRACDDSAVWAAASHAFELSPFKRPMGELLAEEDRRNEGVPVFNVIVEVEGNPSYNATVCAATEGKAKTRAMFDYPHPLRGKLVNYTVERLA